jgi:hypothetical protein
VVLVLEVGVAYTGVRILNFCAEVCDVKCAQFVLVSEFSCNRQNRDFI